LSVESTRRAAPLCLLLAIGLLGASGCAEEDEPQGLGPISASVFPDGEGPFTSYDLFANAFVNHPVGTPVPTYSYSWTCTGACPAAAPGPYTERTVPAADTTKDDVWEVTATATFGSTIVGPDTASLTIINSKPVVEVDRITNRNPACPDEGITVVATGSDADVDPVTLNYQWTVDNVVEPAATGPTIDCQYFEVGERVRVRVQPFDGEEFGRIEFSNVVLVGPPPDPATSPVESPAVAAASASDGGVSDEAAEPLVHIGLSAAAVRPDTLAVTEANACHIDARGAIVCTGEPAHGLTEPPAGAFSQLALELDYACALRSDDASVVCWGDPVDDVGQLDPPAGAFSQLAVGTTAACALDFGGAIACWGDDPDGLATPPAGAFVELDVSQSSGCAMDADGAVACWGRTE
jgi:hypothetical protein